MKRLVLAVVLGSFCCMAQQQPDPQHGGAAAARPGAVQSPEAGKAHAEAAAKHGEGHEEAPMPNEIWWKWANFAILAGVLGWLIAKNAGPFFRSRSEAIQSGIREASQMRADAEARAAEIERRVSTLTADVAALREASLAEIARESERMRKETAEQIQKIQAQAELEIASAAKHASQELKAHSAELAIRIAEGQIRSRVSAESEAQFTDAFIEGIRGKAGLN